MDAPDHAPVQNTTTLYYLLPGPAYIEFGLNLIGPLPNLYFLCLLKRPFFHLNLRILLAHLSITLVLLNISRLLSLVDAWGNFLTDTAEYIITCVNESFVYIIINSANLMCAERIFATVLVERYERVRRWWITVVSITVTVSLNVWLSFYCRSLFTTVHKTRPGRFTTAKENDEFAIILTCNMAVNVIALSIFIILGQCNQRRWKGALQKKLSHKYQILENIRTARQLIIVLLLAFFTSLYYYISVMYILLNRDSGTVARVLIQMFDLSVSVFSVFLPCIFIKTHPRMNVVAKRHLKRNLHLSRLCPAPTPRMQKRSVSVVVEEANMYFSDLQKSWSNAGRRK